MQRVPYIENCGDDNRDENHDHSSAPDSFALCISDVRMLIRTYSELPPVEQKVFILQYCGKITSPSEIALELGWQSRGSAQTIQKRLNKKLGKLQQQMHGPIKINPEIEGKDDNEYPDKDDADS